MAHIDVQIDTIKLDGRQEASNEEETDRAEDRVQNSSEWDTAITVQNGEHERDKPDMMERGDDLKISRRGPRDVARSADGEVGG
jgi:hypothetical protein